MLEVVHAGRVEREHLDQSQSGIAMIMWREATLPIALEASCTSEFMPYASARRAIFIIPVMPPLITTSPRRQSLAPACSHAGRAHSPPSVISAAIIGSGGAA